jgi:two-component system, LuxR family, response regulator FixJ
MSNEVHRQTVFIVDDDPSIRDALALLFSLHGHATAMFACAEDFLRAIEPGWRGVVIADIRMGGMSGLEMQEVLSKHPSRLPVIVITAHADIAAARHAFRFHAVDFLEKPFDHDQLLASVERAMRGLPELPAAIGTRPVATTLSGREKEVMAMVVDGMDNGSIGAKLGISPRTVEVHKSRLMTKLGARNLAELVRIAQAAQGGQPPQ